MLEMHGDNALDALRPQPACMVRRQIKVSTPVSEKVEAHWLASAEVDLPLARLEDDRTALVGCTVIQIVLRDRENLIVEQVGCQGRARIWVPEPRAAWTSSRRRCGAAGVDLQLHTVHGGPHPGLSTKWDRVVLPPIRVNVERAKGGRNGRAHPSRVIASK